MARPIRRAPVSQIVLEEIALEGLEGITLPSLWTYLSFDLDAPLPFASDVQNRVWNFIKRNTHQLEFYELPIERPPIQLENRFAYEDPDFGVTLAPDPAKFTRYKFVPIEDGKKIYGSCEFYRERVRIEEKEVIDLSAEATYERWGDRFVIVATQDLRYCVLTPKDKPIPEDLTCIQYCFWEAVGRSRYNGETTSGPYSILHICKDPSIVFYIKNKLVQYGLIVAQSFNEYRDQKFALTSLLNLAQYVPDVPDGVLLLVEKIYDLVKKSPDNVLPITKLRDEIPRLSRKSIFRRLAVTPFFQRVFEVKKTKKLKKSEKGTEGYLEIVLKNPETPLNKLIEEVSNEEKIDDEGDFKNEFADYKHSFVDMPLKEEFYRAVLRHGARGASLTELGNYLSEAQTVVRQMAKAMLRDGLIISHTADEGRQRTHRYVALEITKSTKGGEDNDQPKLDEIMKFTEHLNIEQPPIEKYATDSALAEIETTLNDYVWDVRLYRISHTPRQVNRRNYIIQQLNEHGLLSTVTLRHRLQESEHKQGITDDICSKSLRRLLMDLKSTHNLKAYEIILNFQNVNRTYQYVAHPSIDKNHILIQCELTRLKSLLLSRKQQDDRQKRSRYRRIARYGTVKKVMGMRVPVPELSSKPPKFLISRYMHEFLFYIVVELNDHQQMIEIDENLLQTWRVSEPELQVHEFVQSLHAGNEVQHAYTQELSWRTFITPLPSYADKPAGWVYLSDAIDRMPLSIFNQIFNFEQNENDKLAEYLKHPVRQHYLMRQLPNDIQKLINLTHLQKICTLVLKVLHHMGLIQINDSFSKFKKDSMLLWIYLNRRTQILDTTTSEASYAKINTAREYEELTFNFSTFDDITSYWAQIHRICIYTKLGVRTEKHNNNSPTRKEFHFLPSVCFDDAPQYDTGEVPGDHAGAAGFAAFLFSHSLRNWSWVLRTNTQTQKPPQQQHAHSNRISLLRNTSTKYLRLMGMRKSRLHLSQVKRTSAVSAAITGVATVKRYIKKKSASMRDAIDRDALNNMRTLRVIWKKEEDDLLKLARAVYVYIGASVNILGLTVVSRICRDVIRHNLGICNKTSQACTRRIHYIIRIGRHKPEVPSWVHMLQTNNVIHKLYGDNFLERLKLLYPQREDYCEALSIHFIKIFNFLYELVHNRKGDEAFAGSSALCPRFVIPNCLDEFNRIFIKRTPTPDERIIHYNNPSNEYETLTMIAIAVLHSSLCSALDKTTYTAQAFEIFKKFSEEVLQNAYFVARNGGLIVASKRKTVERLPSQMTSPAYSFSNLYQRRLNFLSIPYVIYDTFYEFLQNVIGIFPQPKSEFIDQASTSKTSALTNIVELKSPNAGQLFLIAEGLARNLWVCKVKLPVNILTVDAEQRQTFSAMDKMLDHYHCIFDNAPEVEYTKQIGNEVKEKQVRVKFHPANLSYKIAYSPYDLISKLPVRHLHFFCALDYLDHEVEINFSGLTYKDEDHDTLKIECPFNCILKQANYINAIERIVQEKSIILKELKEMPPQKLLNMAMSGCSVKVEASNLLTLVRMLESFWREKESAYERKDLGRLPANLKAIKSIDWHQMCCEILEFNITEEEYEKNDEYEPTLNKEERLTRAQDVFVVSLPTLQLEMNTDYRNDSKETAIHNGLFVPKRLVEAEIARDAILRKIVDESHWKYTDNTLPALKPKLNNRGFTAMEQQHVEDLLRYIESHKLGVPVTELMREFPYIQFLSRALRVLSDHYLIKRVGIATMMYVHKSNIRPWVVHTFHIKRLERENLGPVGKVNLKRAATSGEEDIDDIEETDSSKRSKLTNNSADLTQDGPSTSKRIPKPVQRFQSENTPEKTMEKEHKRDVIVMKPHAWIRLNGTINRRVLDRWMGSILTECITRSGCMIEEIYTKFPYLSPVEIMFLLEILSEIKCIHLTEIKPTKTSIFSSYEKLQENIVKDIYDPKYTYVTAHGDAITRMSIFIGNKKYSTQFI